jgi:EAL domain-containing protein (putative c-di-GMP-specific phosphodiesterase class I)
MTIALDRLGATAISRESLERLPARTWKLHRGLVARTAGHRDAALLVESLTALAHDMRVRTVAVGVESTEQQALAARLGCDAIQGFLRAEALPPAQFEALLIAHLERHGPRRGARG